MESLFNEAVLNEIAEIELIYKTKVKASARPQIKTSRDAAELLKKNWDENKIDFVEQFKVVFLNKANRVLGIHEQSTGGVTSTTVDIKLIFVAALKANACNIIISHNHPSGNLKPSQQDQELTTKIKMAGKLLDILLFDHIIVTSEGHFSFADEGLI